jgi:hypothetical protein
MADRISIIPREAVPLCGSFEVRFPDGRESRFFYFDDIAGRRLRPDLVDSATAKRDARMFARVQQDELDSKEQKWNTPPSYFWSLWLRLRALKIAAHILPAPSDLHVRVLIIPAWSRSANGASRKPQTWDWLRTSNTPPPRIMLRRACSAATDGAKRAGKRGANVGPHFEPARMGTTSWFSKKERMAEYYGPPIVSFYRRFGFNRFGFKMYFFTENDLAHITLLKRMWWVYYAAELTRLVAAASLWGDLNGDGQLRRPSMRRIEALYSDQAFPKLNGLAVYKRFRQLSGLLHAVAI